MRADTITRAQALMPATREEMEQRLGLKPGSCRHVVQHMLSKGYAKEWGDKLTSRGTLAPVCIRLERNHVDQHAERC